MLPIRRRLRCWVWTVWAFSLGFAMLPLLGSIAGSGSGPLLNSEVCSVEHSTALPGSLSDLDTAVRLGDHGIHCALCATAAGTGAVLVAAADTPQLPRWVEPARHATVRSESVRSAAVPEAPRPRGPPSNA